MGSDEGGRGSKSLVQTIPPGRYNGSPSRSPGMGRLQVGDGGEDLGHAKFCSLNLCMGVVVSHRPQNKAGGESRKCPQGTSILEPEP